MVKAIRSRVKKVLSFINVLRQTGQAQDRIHELENDMVAKDQEIRALNEAHKRELASLQEYLDAAAKKSWGEKCDQEKLVEKIYGSIVKVLQKAETMTEHEFRQQLEWSVCEEPGENSEYMVTTAFCSLGGCEYRGFMFKKEQTADICAMILQESGYKLDTGGACQSCADEYLAGLT